LNQATLVPSGVLVLLDVGVALEDDSPFGQVADGGGHVGDLPAEEGVAGGLVMRRLLHA
jgi:hypothetical protein